VSRGPRWPRAIERSLAARLRRRQRFTRHLVLEHLRSLPRHDSTRADGWLGDTIRRIGQRVREALGLAQPLTPSSLAPTARAVDAVVSAEVARVLGQPVPEAGPLDPSREAIRVWTEDAARRIREAEAATVDRAVEAAAVAADAGADPVVAAQEATESAEVRGALAARDLVGTLVATVTEVRARRLGSDRYVWRSQQDHRVRPLHADLDGTVQRWSQPHPTEGRPGDQFACRCVAEPLPAVVLPDAGGLLR
jgi:SPP1 gp7 family putative phage head morphogenesis protein